LFERLIRLTFYVQYAPMLSFGYLHNIIYLGNTSLPWHNIDPKENHKQFIKDNEFSSSSGSDAHG